jgi:hypothetical protein
MNPNAYPFTTRRQIVERVESDPSFAGECIAILQDRHDRRAAAAGESMGWMASHASTATKLAARLASGEATEKDRAEAAKLAGRYSKQLARVFRERELAARPELGAQAAVFGVGSGGEAQPTPGTRTPGKSEEQPAPAKRRGRPKGSKNKPGEAPKPSGRRSRR